MFKLALLAAAAFILGIAATAAPVPPPRPLQWCLGMPATIVGTVGSDMIVGTARHDVIVGLGGDDTIEGGGGPDRICGGEGTDTLSFAGSGEGVTADLGTGDAGKIAVEGIESLLGSAFADRLVGDGGANTIDGGSGADSLYGAGGADDLFAGPGDDTLFGDAGDDLLMGFDGNERLDGGAGDDIIRGGAGANVADGGHGTDECTDYELGESCERVGQGVLRVALANTDVASLDPAIAFDVVSWRLLRLTCLNLVGYPDANDPAGSQIVPQAAALPQVSPDGLTYTFTIRDGLRFAPPSNQSLTATTFKYTIERALSPYLGSPAVAFLHDVVGADDYSAGSASEIVGIDATGQTLTVRLVRPQGDLPARLAMTFFCPVPIGTPHVPQAVVPAAGPYMLIDRQVARTTTLARNPNYRGRRPSTFDRIEWTANLDENQATALVESGVSDVLDFLSATAAERLRALYGPGSPAAAAGRQRYFVEPTQGLNYLALNTQRVFSSKSLRRAVAFAVDRNHFAGAAGFDANAPTDQILTPKLPGYVDAAIFPASSDLAAARLLATAAGVTPTSRVTVRLYASLSAVSGARAESIRASLEPLGVDVQIERYPFSELVRRLGTRSEPFDLAIIGWVPDYLDPYAVLDTLLNGGRILEANNVTFSYFNEPAYNARLDVAAALPPGAGRDEAYTKLDHDLSAEAAVLPMSRTLARLFFADRIGCQTFVPQTDVALNALCAR